MRGDIQVPTCAKAFRCQVVQCRVGQRPPGIVDGSRMNAWSWHHWHHLHRPTKNLTWTRTDPKRPLSRIQFRNGCPLWGDLALLRESGQCWEPALTLGLLVHHRYSSLHPQQPLLYQDVGLHFARSTYLLMIDALGQNILQSSRPWNREIGDRVNIAQPKKKHTHTLSA